MILDVNLKSVPIINHKKTGGAIIDKIEPTINSFLSLSESKRQSLVKSDTNKRYINIMVKICVVINVIIAIGIHTT